MGAPGVRTAAPDDELLAVVRSAFAGRRVRSLARRPHPYATSFALEELTVRFADGGGETLVFKDLAWDRLLPDASRAKPRFLYEPRRAVETYRRILAPAGIGVRCHAALADEAAGGPSRHWLLLEKVPGVPLWQIGDDATWDGVARWLAGFHARFAGRLGEVRAANPYLLDYGPELFELWLDRARAALRSSDDERAPRLLDALEGYGALIDAMAAFPASFVHGEFYPLNILVAGVGPDVQVWPVDWEMAATGPTALDLAALVAGWDDQHRQRLVSAYRARLVELTDDVPPSDVLQHGVDCCRLHLALQWLGWSPGWVAKDGRDLDWLGEALGLARNVSF